ncbi:MAG: HAMP domain-containing sensor histidine kinase [Deltaproteobacteria bacterium]|nr:HAMP domain-containing sensor histidine kinase [Deltaproteobacteria bacterium]
MEHREVTRVRKLRREMSMTGVIVALCVGVVLPVMLSTSVGIVTLALGRGSGSIVIGVLTISFAAAAIGGVVAASVLLSRRARLARLQADFLANVTHELRTPLAAIRLYAETLMTGRLADDPKRAAQCMETILRETEWLEAMIDRVLTWRAAVKDRAELKKEVASVREAVEEAVARFVRMTPPGEVELSVSIGSDTVVAHDRHAVSSAVLNLLVNAYKYSERDKRIEVGVTDGDGVVEIAVADNGVGMEAKELARVFEPFYRVDSRLRARSSGAGLGLAIVRHEIEAHGGTVGVESEVGKGSRFTLRLPAAGKEKAA